MLAVIAASDGDRGSVPPWRVLLQLSGRSDPLPVPSLSPQGSRQPASDGIRQRVPETGVPTPFRSRDYEVFGPYGRALKPAITCAILRLASALSRLDAFASTPAGLTALTRPKQAVDLLSCGGRFELTHFARVGFSVVREERRGARH
jgi:hypothetical protein